MRTFLLSLILLAGYNGSAQSLQEAGFELSYSYAGMGSNTGGWFPGLKLDGNSFTYQIEQNSCYSGELAPPIKQINGTLSNETMSDLELIFNSLPDTVIHATNVSVLSGGVHTIVLASPVKMVKFILYNEWHATAQQIVDLLNPYIPEDQTKLWLIAQPQHKD